MLFGGSLQVYRYVRDANAVERQQTKWIILGVVIFVTAIISWVLVFGRALPVPDGRPRIIANLLGMVYSDYFALPFLPIAITIAILRYKMWGIDVIIRKTLLYTAITALLALVFFGSVILLQRLFEAVTGQQSQLAIVLSTLAIAVLFNPLRTRIQADRPALLSQEVRCAAGVGPLRHTARDETDMNALTGELVRVVQEAMEPETVSIWLKREQRQFALFFVTFSRRPFFNL